MISVEKKSGYLSGKKPILAIFIVAFVIRLFLVFGLHNYRNAVTYENGEIADNIIAGYGYSCACFFSPKQPTAYMPPAYPLILTANKIVFGNNYLFLEILQSIAGALTCCIVFVVFRNIGFPVEGFIAGLLASLDPIHAASVTAVNEQAIHSLILTVFIYLCFKIALDKKIKIKHTILLGLIAGLFLHLKPVALPFLLICWVWIFWRTDGKKRVIAEFILYLVILTVVSAPWAIRNYYVFGKVFLVSNNFEVNLWQGSNPYVCGSTYTCDGKSVNTTLTEDVKNELAVSSEMRRNEILRDIAMNFIKSDPERWVSIRLKNFLFFWTGHAYWIKSYPMKYPFYVKIALKYYNVALFIGFVAGLFFVNRAQWRYFILPFALIMFYCGIYTVIHADIYDRYRLPLDPFLMFPIACIFSFVKKVKNDTNS